MANPLDSFVDIDLQQDPNKRQPKIIFAGDQWEDGMPYVLITEDAIVIMGDKHMAINASKEFGTLISGKVSLSAMPNQISFCGGYWRLNPQLLSTVPSTTPTPVPWLVKAIPELFRGREGVQNALSLATEHSDIAT